MPDPSPAPPDGQVLRAVAGALAPPGGRPPTILGTELLAARRSRVYRVRLSGPSGTPATAILKAVRSEPDRPYDPDDPDPHGRAALLHNEWAGYAWLDTLPALRGLAPRLLGSDRTLGVLVLEDLGPGASLADRLLGADRAAAGEGMRAYAATLGRLHAATAGRFDAYRALRASLGPGDGRALPAPAELPAELETLGRFADGAGVPVPAAARAEAAAAAAALEDAGPFLAYSPSDVCPDNNRDSGDGTLRLFDFEGGGFRHALLDAAYLRLALPSCWCVNRLPSGLVPRLETIYRAELRRGCPAAGDDLRFEAGLVDACAAWLIWSVSWQWQETPDADRQLGPTTFRQSILRRLGLFGAMPAAQRRRPALAGLARRLRAVLRRRWRDVPPMPLYPAFRPS
jgi:hypothetical protein